MLYRAVRSVQEIAEQRVLSGGTVIEHLCAMIEAREHIEWERLALAEQYTRIVAAIELFQSPQLGRQRTLALSAPTEGEYTDGNRKGQVDIQRAPVR